MDEPEDEDENGEDERVPRRGALCEKARDESRRKRPERSQGEVEDIGLGRDRPGPGYREPRREERGQSCVRGHHDEREQDGSAQDSEDASDHGSPPV